jgi:EAL and modified HD-GYP domain-containing signal transduction protein
MHDLFVGRQPIYDRDLKVYAYELLYRGSDVDFADFSEGDRATSQVLQNTFTEIGLERVVGDHLSFVNLTRGFVTGEYPLPVPRERVVLEILEDIEPDAEVLKGIRALKADGFVIALDDFLFEEWKRPLTSLADIIKVEVLGLSDDEVRRQVEQLAEFDCKLLAEKIETREQFDPASCRGGRCRRPACR